jgi:hypothetical protein
MHPEWFYMKEDRFLLLTETADYCSISVNLQIHIQTTRRNINATIIFIMWQSVILVAQEYI